MKAIALTAGVASGKTSLAHALKDRWIQEKDGIANVIDVTIGVKDAIRDEYSLNPDKDAIGQSIMLESIINIQRQVVRNASGVEEMSQKEVLVIFNRSALDALFYLCSQLGIDKMPPEAIRNICSRYDLVGVCYGSFGERGQQAFDGWERLRDLSANVMCSVVPEEKLIVLPEGMDLGSRLSCVWDRMEALK